VYCYDDLYNLCNRFFTDDQEIVSAINNGMLRVFKNKASITTWIYTIVRNEALTIVRNKKSLKIIKELHTDLPEAVKENPFATSLVEDILLYLNNLSFDTRATCNLYYLEEYSIKEIASVLDMKEGTVKWHLSEGRKKLQLMFNTHKKQIEKVG
jgi:RNA polymerase sigma factor (sigma-70 family)